MSRELWLLRHGKSDRDSDLADIDRPLKKRGKRAAHTLGAWMRRQELIPDRVLTSPAERATATAIRVCEELGVGIDAVYQDKRLYASNIELIQGVLAECPEGVQRLLLVGHNPELEQFLTDLVGVADLPLKKKLMPTTTLARMAMPDDWTRLEPGCAKLLSITDVKSLFDETD